MPKTRTVDLAPLVASVPVLVLAVGTWALAWDTSGSIEAAHWLPYAIVAALVLAAVLLSGAAVSPPRLPLAAALLLLAFAAWTAITAAWSPAPPLARDDALLALLYAVAFLTPLVTLRSAHDRLVATAVVVLALGSLAAWTAFWLRGHGDPELLYYAGRLDFPITYWNGQAAIALVAFWPAIALAARRTAHPLLRAAALGFATAMLCLWLGTQSKGGGVALAVSAVAVFAVAGSRLRLLLPSLAAAGLAAFAARPLTEPFRTDGPAFDEAVRHAGSVTLLLAAAGAAAGLAYALVDTRVRIGHRARLWIGRGVLAAACAVAAAGIVAFFAAVEHPVGATQDRWRDFKDINSGASASSHFGALGSNRYDFWRVAWNEFEEHPLAGIGAYGWGNVYLVRGASEETPQRSHSVELDALSETGIVGFLLLAGAGLAALVAVGRRARRSLHAAGALGTAVYFTVHTGGDWVWTMPAVGIPAFALVGIALSSDRRTLVPARVALPAGIAALAAALVAFLPPWLSWRFVEVAYDRGTLAAAADELRWARRLDPLAVDPLLAEYALARPPATIPPLRRAVEKQPRNAELHFILGRALLDLGRAREARRELRIALRLSPRDLAIRNALDEAGA